MTLNTDDTLLTPDNHALMLIDHQYLHLLTVRSHSVETIVNNATFLAEADGAGRRTTAVHRQVCQRSATRLEPG